ncbi:host specificity factor TipJ family phage tail protein [Comamonas kerstersii]|nr:host specificity factor TipJ family phage tail protein [Comamonas kerstersii]
MLSALQMGVFVAGSILINKVLGPKTPKAGTPEEAKQVYSLRSQRNSARAYEPVPVLFGEMRVVPDLASQPYTWHQSEDQYLSTILLGGVGVHSAADLAIGDTPISSYQDVDVYYNGFSGMPNQKIPLSSNMDSLAGGAIEDDETWVTRTSSPGAIQLAVDLEYVMYLQGNKGLLWAHSDITVQYRKVGTSEWRVLTGAVKRIGNNKAEPRRVTWQQPVDEGQYEVRMKQKKVARTDQNGTNGFRQVTWVSLRSTQPDNTDYSAFGRIGIKIKATGQISGSLDTVRVTYRAKPMPIWTGTAWATATTRENGLSNPGAILLQTLRGIWHKGKLQFGFGLSDDQIDIDGLKAFMLHCTANGYTYDRWITSSISLHDFCQEVALAGMGEFSWTDGSRPTAVFVSDGQPVSAVVNMANMLKASFSVDYALSNAADGIEYQYVDRDKGFETQTLRVTAPGVTTMLNPARVPGYGVTTEAHAAIMARYHLAQSLYQYKAIGYTADIEHLDYRRLSVLSISHDLTQWGYGGRVLAAERAGDDVRITLDEAVPPLETPHLGLRLPGDRDYRVWKVQALTEASNTLTLIGEWPEDLPLPGEGDNPMDTLWCYDFKATPGYRVRVTSLEPESDLKGAKVTCVPEGPEFWDYVLNGTYVPAPSQTALPQHARASVKNLRVTEHVNVQGDTEWYELSALWDVEGDYDHAQVWAGVDGSELQLVDANAVGSRTRFRIDGPGQWLVEVRPFNAGGQVGQSAAVLYITTLVQRAPRNVDNFTVQELAGGLRRFAWQYTGDKPPALAGVQIRYVPGDVALSTDMWGDMTPLGQPDDVYKAQFETTRPEAGLWTFGIRAIDTAGQLSSGVVRFVANLGDSFEQVQQPDVTPPPVPTGLAATGAFATVQVSWDVPVYDQGHGHSRTEVWAGVTADIADAAKVAEAYAGPASFEWTLGSTAYVWARNVTQDGVAGDWAGPVTAQTAQDAAALGEVLKGQITQSQLHADLSGRVDMIDVLDVGRPELGVATGLIQATAALAAADVQKRDEIDAAARQALEALLIADRALERITDAGVYVDPESGTVKIAGLEATRDEVTQLEVLLDAVQGQLALKATTAYVDGKIAEAVLSPADLLLYEGLDARVTSVTQALNSVNGQLAQKASAAELTQALVRLTTAENNLDALSGQIALRVTRSEWESAQQGLENRISSAEVTLSALDVPSITQTVIATRRLDKSADKAAEALLRDILTGERNRSEAAEALAFARTELSAAITEGLQAEAQQRTQLAAKVDSQAAALSQESTARSTADEALAQQQQALVAQVMQTDQRLQAQIQSESQARADADAAEATQRQLLAATVAANRTEGLNAVDAAFAAISAEQTARANAISAEASARQTLAATVSSNHSAALAAAQAASDAAGSKGKVIFGSSAPAVADRLAQNLWIDSTGGANTPKRWNGSAWVAVTDKAATDAAAAAAQAQATANNAVAAIQTEQSVRANETGHLGAQYTVRMQLGQGGQQVIGGFGLSGTSSQTAGAHIDFGVLANIFWVAAPNGSGVANVRPFSVQTTAQTVNGVVVPAGVYMDAAYINNVTALWARFGTLVADSIQATAISAGQLTAGNGVIGGSLKSSNYVAGSSGWTLRPDGVAEFSGVIVRGTVYATSGTVGGWSIGSNYLRSSNYQAGVRGVNFGSDGSVEIRSTDGTRAFNLQATGTQALLAVPGLSILGNGSATFSGNLSGASGSFSGTLTASNIINTSHLVNGAVSSAVGAFSNDQGSFTVHDTEVAIETVTLSVAGGRVVVLAGLVLQASGRFTSSLNPLVRVRLKRNGSELRRLDVNATIYFESGTSAIARTYLTLPPLVDSPGAGVHVYTLSLEARNMDTSPVRVNYWHRGLSAMEVKR